MEAAGHRSLSPGTMLDDKYRIERLLAVGGMGAVYLGSHVKLRKRIAIKILNPQLSTPAMIERFHREAITASQIGHEGIAQVTDLGTSAEGEPFLVMEYLEGESLASRIRASAPLAIEVACELGCSILSPLNAAHLAGIVHRDLKPDNVFLVRQSRGEMVKLLDFGISRTTGLDNEFRLTTTGLILGTPYYMSPEQARGDSEVGPAADLYAFGVILYEMLIGRVPIQAENYNQLMYRVMTADFERPRTQRTELPEALEQLILGAMALEPGDRPASAVELEHALLAFCRPTFREHTIERLSASGLAFRPSASSIPASHTPASHTPASHTPVGAGATKSRIGIEHTLLGTSPGAAVPTPSPLATPEPAPPRRSRAPLVVVLALLGSGAVAAVVATRGSSTESPPSPVAAPIASPAASPVEPDAPPPSSEPATGITAVVPDAAVAPVAAIDAAASVTLRFAIEPPTASIKLDGVVMTGTELVVPKDDATHELAITAPNHIAHVEEVRFDESQRLVVQLKRTAPPRRPDRATTEPRKQPPEDPPKDPRPDRRPERIDTESPYK